MELEKKDRYINFYTDFAFKRLFGTEVNKDLLINFLNALLAGEEKITDISYLNTEHFSTIEPMRKAVFDVYCRNDKGEYFIVEMQKAEQSHFKDRSIFYSTFPIQEQAAKGKSWDYSLKAVYTIGILNFCLDESDDEYYHHEVKLMDTRTKTVFYDKLTYIYLEMPKFTKGLDELETMTDKWLYAIRHLPTLLEKPHILTEDVFTRLFEQAEIAHFNQNEIFEYRESLKDYWDYYSVMKTASDKGMEKGMEKGRVIGREEGIAEGIEIGMSKGREEGRYEGMRLAARKMKERGFDIENISLITGLTKSEIEAL